MKKILSLSLWGNNPKYTIGAIENIKLAAELYPEWIVRLYVDSVAHDCIADKVNDYNNFEFVVQKAEGDWNGMLWRFLPSIEDGIDVTISRDCDSRITIREKDAVNEWLSSDKDFHIMRDHPFHDIQILGGMWGCRNNIFKKIGISSIDPDSYENKWQVDQHFLRYEVYPKVFDTIFVHDPYNHFPNEKNVKDFPSPRINSHFVGEIFDGDNNRHPDHYTLL